MKTLISLFFLLLAGSSLFGQVVVDAKFVAGEGNSMLFIEVDSSNAVAEVFVEVGSTAGTNDRLDVIYYANPNAGQRGFRRLDDTKLLISLPELAGTAPHHFRIRLEDLFGEISPALSFIYSL